MPKNLVDADVWEANVVSPVDGDVADAPSVEVGLQDLANRSYHNVLAIGGTAGTSEWIYKDGSRVRTAMFLPTGFQYEADSSNYTMNFTLGRLELEDNNMKAWLDLSKLFPNAATITQIRAVVDPGISSTGMNISCFRVTPDFSTPASNSITAAFDTDTVSGSAIQVLTLTFSQTINKDQSAMVLQIQAGNDAVSGADIVEALEFTYSVPGPDSY